MKKKIKTKKSLSNVNWRKIIISIVIMTFTLITILTILKLKKLFPIDLKIDSHITFIVHSIVILLVATISIVAINICRYHSSTKLEYIVQVIAIVLICSFLILNFLLFITTGEKDIYIALIIICTSIAFILLNLFKNKHIKENKNENDIKFLSDDAIDNKESLTSNRKDLCEQIKNYVKTFGFSNSEIMILDGGFGEGKTSIINSVKDNITKNTICLSALESNDPMILAKLYLKRLKQLLIKNNMFISHKGTINKFINIVSKLAGKSLDLENNKFEETPLVDIKEKFQNIISKLNILLIVDDFDRIDLAERKLMLNFIKEIVGLKGQSVLLLMSYSIMGNEEKEYFEKFINHVFLLPIFQKEEYLEMLFEKMQMQMQTPILNITYYDDVIKEFDFLKNKLISDKEKLEKEKQDDETTINSLNKIKKYLNDFDKFCENPRKLKYFTKHIYLNLKFINNEFYNSVKAKNPEKEMKEYFLKIDAKRLIICCAIIKSCYYETANQLSAIFNLSTNFLNKDISSNFLDWYFDFSLGLNEKHKIFIEMLNKKIVLLSDINQIETNEAKRIMENWANKNEVIILENFDYSISGFLHSFFHRQVSVEIINYFFEVLNNNIAKVKDLNVISGCISLVHQNNFMFFTEQAEQIKNVIDLMTEFLNNNQNYYKKFFMQHQTPEFIFTYFASVADEIFNSARNSVLAVAPFSTNANEFYELLKQNNYKDSPFSYTTSGKTNKDNIQKNKKLLDTVALLCNITSQYCDLSFHKEIIKAMIVMYNSFMHYWETVEKISSLRTKKIILNYFDKATINEVSLAFKDFTNYDDFNESLGNAINNAVFVFCTWIIDNAEQSVKINGISKNEIEKLIACLDKIAELFNGNVTQSVYFYYRAIKVLNDILNKYFSK